MSNNPLFSIFNDFDYRTSCQFAVNWASGYEGYLCSSCISDDEKRYEQVDDFVWEKCPEPILNGFKVIGLFLIVVFFLTGLITMNIRKRDVSQRSVLMRILTNHLQLLTLTFAYNMKYPNFLLDLLAPLSRANSSSESVVSFDWFASESSLRLFAPSIPILKVGITAISPLILMLAWLIFFSLMHIFLPQHFSDFKRNMVISIITIIYFLHPTITTSALGIFQCIEVDKDDSRVRLDLEIKWFSAEHLMWALSFGVPMIAVWVVGAPLLALIALTKNRNKLDEPGVKRYFIVMYQGLRHPMYYWEILNIIRKVLILSFNVFFPDSATMYKGILAVLLVILIYRMQIYLRPYVNKANDDWELISSVATGITLSGGLVFASEETVDVLDIFIFILIIYCNAKFFLLWSFLMSVAWEDMFPWIRKLSTVLGVCLNRKSEGQSQLKTPESMRKSKIKIFGKNRKRNKKKFKNKKVSGKKKAKEVERKIL